MTETFTLLTKVFCLQTCILFYTFYLIVNEVHLECNMLSTGDPEMKFLVSEIYCDDINTDLMKSKLHLKRFFL